MAAALVWGCSEAPTGDVQEAAPVADPAPVAEEIDLVGEWRVAGIDGAAVDLPAALTVSGGPQILDWEPACAQLMHRYRIDGARFSAVRIRQFVTEEAMQSPGAVPSRPPCAIGLPPGVEDAMLAVEMADKIERTAENGIRISGRTRSVTLFSQ